MRVAHRNKLYYLRLSNIFSTLELLFMGISTIFLVVMAQGSLNGTPNIVAAVLNLFSIALQITFSTLAGHYDKLAFKEQDDK